MFSSSLPFGRSGFPTCYHDSQVKARTGKESRQHGLQSLHLLLFRKTVLKLLDQGLDVGVRVDSGPEAEQEQVGDA